MKRVHVLESPQRTRGIISMENIVLGSEVYSEMLDCFQSIEFQFIILVN